MGLSKVSGRSGRSIEVFKEVLKGDSQFLNRVIGGSLRESERSEIEMGSSGM